MTREEVTNKIEILINNSINGLETESSKFDFKRKWYDFNDKYELNEFCRDASAIANTVGLDGFIVIGFDEKTKEFLDTKFENCNLKDPADLQNVIIKKCSDIFDINSYDIVVQNQNLSVVHIPPFKQKPILLPSFISLKKGKEKVEEHRIFVRRNSRTCYANKHDIDKMYYDRKNVEIDYEYYIDILKIRKHSMKSMREINPVHNRINLEFVVENLGRRTLALKTAELDLETSEGYMLLKLATEVNERGNNVKLLSLIRTIPQNSSESMHLMFTNETQERMIKNEQIDKCTLKIILSNGKILTKEIENHGM